MTASIVVSGASGFIGRHLCAALTARGLRVKALVRRPGSAPASVAAEHLAGDLAQHPNLQPWLEGVAAVVHCAGVSALPPRAKAGCYDDLMAANLEATHWLAQQAADAGVGRFIFLSTAKVNGEQTKADQAFVETDAHQPQGAYACSKSLAEQALMALSARRALPCVLIRPPLVYGPGVAGNMLRLMQLVERGVPLPFAGLENRRSLLGVDNLCDFVACALDHPAAVGETFFVADEQVISTRELVLMLAAALQRKARLFWVPPWLLRPLRLHGRLALSLDRLLGSLVVDTAKAQNSLGWRAPMTVAQGVERMVQGYHRTLYDHRASN